MKIKDKIPKYLAELVGTFCLVFAGCGAIVVNEIHAGRVTGLGIGFVFGLVVLAMIYAIGHISGAHMNPAVTLGFYFSRRMEGREVMPYVVSQISGAILASLSLRLIFLGDITTLGVTMPAGPLLQSFVFEFIMTFILMFVIMGVATDNRAQGTMAGVAVGATICLEAIIGGPISGASMNPARSFGPALVTMNFSHQWIYWLAPILGSLTGVIVYKAIQCASPDVKSESGCC